MHPLDDPATYRWRDPGGMVGLVARFPAMGEEAWLLGMRLRLPAALESTAVAVLGMGGSGVGGDLLAALLAPTFPVPVVVVKDSVLPAAVGPQTLLFACSYSGETAETLAAYRAAKAAQAPAIVITSGGTLAAEAERHGDPLVRVPAGLPPRAALPYLFLPMVSALRRLTHLGELSGEWREAAAVLRDLAAELGPEVPLARNPAKRLAATLGERTPAVYGASTALGAVAYRWKCQFNENAKTLAHWGAFPEVNHNETVGWTDGAAAGRTAVVLLREPDEPEERRQRIGATREVAFAGAAAVEEVVARGEGRLSRLLSLVLLGDFTSVYLALLRGVDPTPVPVIDEVKRRVSGTPH